MNVEKTKSSKWERLGLVFKPNTELKWSRSHAMVPTPLKLDDKQLIYYSSRNIFNQSSIGCFEIQLSDKPFLVQSNATPLLEPGDLGCFDDNGVTPSCAIELSSGDIALYYIGWNPGSTTRVNLFGGLAISDDRGKSFVRWSKAPILERTPTDPYMNTAPWVVATDGGYRMYYVSGLGWTNKDSPRYNIKVAFSSDGYKWERSGTVVLDFSSPDETALARPFVIKEDGIWKMWVTRRVGEYAIAYAESNDGLHWERKDSSFGLEPNGEGEEQYMTAYSAVVRSGQEYFMFYNGTNYGMNGILLARNKF
jgi:predicted GH43/DUF377 family glycosyl hydrolase